MKNELSKKLTKSEIAEFEKEIEEIRRETLSKLGEEDANYIRDIERQARYFTILGRLLIHFSLDPLTWSAGVTLLGLGKIIDNMELGHNVMHGQYDWMNDPHLNSQTFDWDNACENGHWKFSHNYMHHTYTNILGKDHDLGYGMTRVSSDQEWKPENLVQIITNLGLALIFEYGVGRHGRDVEFKEMDESRKTDALKQENSSRFTKKISRLLIRDYLVFPLLAGPGAGKVLLGNLAANVMRNLWTYSVIFCGHFTQDIEIFHQQGIENESRGDWYLRQLKGSSNLEGNKLFYMLTGHLSHQIEHHMFPDLPANRYEEIAPKIQSICKKYNQNYNTGNFFSQFLQVGKRILAYSFPNPIAEKIMAA
ncbi:MAG: acyl-CoA desaturase [Leptospiraceae bacterium]|nr:acyl-CoA desaturase [Leptospiraceae bacterium]MCP5510548.1 acyl-CoA desaturase [Leptospiraceae bacterium]